MFKIKNHKIAKMIQIKKIKNKSTKIKIEKFIKNNKIRKIHNLKIQKIHKLENSSRKIKKKNHQN